MKQKEKQTADALARFHHSIRKSESSVITFYQLCSPLSVNDRGDIGKNSVPNLYPLVFLGWSTAVQSAMFTSRKERARCRRRSPNVISF